MKIRRLLILLFVPVLVVAGLYGIFLSNQAERQWQLSRAAFEGDIANVKRFIEAGVDIDAVPTDASDAVTGLPAITAASYSGHVDIVRYLLAHGANPNLDGVRNPLIVACWKRHYLVAKLLLENGADPNVRGEDSPISAAEATGQSDLVKLLRNHGAHE